MQTAKCLHSHANPGNAASPGLELGTGVTRWTETQAWSTWMGMQGPSETAPSSGRRGAERGCPGTSLHASQPMLGLGEEHHTAASTLLCCTSSSWGSERAGGIRRAGLEARPQMGTIVAGRLDPSPYSHAIRWSRVVWGPVHTAEQPSRRRAPRGAGWPPPQGGGGRCRPVAQPPQHLPQLWEPRERGPPRLTGPPCMPHTAASAPDWSHALAAVASFPPNRARPHRGG